MLSDNIRKYRKENNMSQDELAEKLGVSRQSVSLWENGQTQPTIDNIIALSKIFNVSSDAILGNETGATAAVENPPMKKTGRKDLIIISVSAVVLLVCIILLTVLFVTGRRPSTVTTDTGRDNAFASETMYGGVSTEPPVTSQSENSRSTAGTTIAPVTPAAPGTTAPKTGTSSKTERPVTSKPKTNAPVTSKPKTNAPNTAAPPEPTDPGDDFDLFTYCKNFAIDIGNLYGDYCIYQRSAELYGGYSGEYFSVSYWADSDMVEFCLHCPLSDTFSVNFYLRMRGGYNGKYEYLSSRYYRDSGKSLRSASGYIDPAVFSDRYPLNCDNYIGSAEGQTEFMEESRVGICDLIRLLKKFVEVENMDCNFSAFGFVNF